MRNPMIKTALLLAGCVFMNLADVSAQAKMTNGPELDNERESKMNRILGGDDNSFYCYRVRSKGRGTSFYIEKYNKGTLKPEFSKEISLGEDENKTKIEDVEYASGNIFVFRRQYDKKEDKMTLFFQTISSTGVVAENLKEIVTISSDHYEFVDFDIFPNPGKTKFVVKAAHKADKKDSYKTDLIMVDAVNIKKLGSRRINENLHAGSASVFSFFGVGVGGNDYGFIGLHLDDKDNIFYCVNEVVRDDKERRRNLNLYTLMAGEQAPKKLNLPFDDYYSVSDIEFSKSNDNDIVVGGFLKDVVERKGRDLVKCGIFSFKVNVDKNSVTGKATQFFDDKMLIALESSPKKSRYNNYKLDYIMPVGDAVYYVGEQYNVTEVTQYTNGRATNTYWQYEYMDVIVAKLNAKGEFEWVKNVPLRNEMRMNYEHVFKQYIAVATDKNLYILCDDHPKNIERYKKADFEPRDLKSVTGIHGSNFVCNTVSLANGKVTNRTVLMENEDYCFAPIQERNPHFVPPSDCEIFVPGKNNEIYIYTEDRGRDRFAKIKFD